MTSMPLKSIRGGIATLLLSAGFGAHAIELGKIGDTTVTMGGYVKLDAMYTDFEDGTRPAQDLSRDFYIPSLTPVGGTGEGGVIDFHARQSRINFGTASEVDGHQLKTFIEVDFLASAGGNERITNSYSPRLRHAFLTYDKWLFGQTWTTFQNVGALPETADFIGNTDFGIFGRQAQIRYTNGPWMFALENPESTITPFGGGGRIVTDDNGTPDVVARYNLTSGSLSLTFAALLRQLAYDDSATIDSTTSSTGLSVSGKNVFGSGDDIRFGVNTGSGMGRYIGLNVSNGGVLDANGDIEAIDSTAYYFAYRHLWSSKTRSTISYSAIEIDNDIALTGAGAIDTTDSLRVNLFYSPVPKLSLGWELALANKELESGIDGSMTRLQFTAKLGF
jgi:hypothetical protein